MGCSPSRRATADDEKEDAPSPRTGPARTPPHAPPAPSASTASSSSAPDAPPPSKPLQSFASSVIAFSKPLNYGALGPKIFEGIKVSQRTIDQANAYIAAMEAHDGDPFAPVPYLTTKGLLLGFARTKRWRIAIHVCSWAKGKRVSAGAIDSFVKGMQASVDGWLTKLRGKFGFPNQRVVVQVYGFAFAPGVEWDESFENKYGSYPRVGKWPEKAMRSAWKLESVSADGEKAIPVSATPWQNKSLDLSTLRVSDQGAAPSGANGFETILKIEALPKNANPKPAAFAQRHYVHLIGHEDAETGILTPRGRAVMLHEVGHCLFLDDLYPRLIRANDPNKSRKYPTSVCPLCVIDYKDSIMMLPSNMPDVEAWYVMRLEGGYANALRPLDHVMLRRSWQVQRQKFL